MSTNTETADDTTDEQAARDILDRSHPKNRPTSELQDEVTEVWDLLMGEEVSFDTRDELQARSQQLYTILDQRLDAGYPACERCESRDWGQEPGGPLHCAGCDRVPDDVTREQVHEIWRYLSGDLDDHELTLEGPAGLDITVTVPADSREDALQRLQGWHWYEVGVEDTSGAWDHVTVAAPTAKRAEEKAEVKAEAQAFNKIDHGSAYDATGLGRIEQVYDDWHGSDDTWGEDFTVVLAADGTQSIAGDGLKTASEAVFNRMQADESAFSAGDRPDDPADVPAEAEASATWTTESPWTRAECEVSLELAGEASLVVCEFDVLANAVDDALDSDWTRTDDSDGTEADQ